MGRHPRHDRTARLLETRLEALARVCERASAPQAGFDEHVLGVVAATRNAVALDLLSAEEADAIWADVRTRHPAAEWCRMGTDLAA